MRSYHRNFMDPSDFWQDFLPPQLRAAAGGSLAVSSPRSLVWTRRPPYGYEKTLLANLHEGLVAWDNGILLAAAQPGISGDRRSTFHLREVTGPTGSGDSL